MMGIITASFYLHNIQFCSIICNIYHDFFLKNYLVSIIEKDVFSICFRYEFERVVNYVQFTFDNKTRGSSVLMVT